MNYELFPSFYDTSNQGTFRKRAASPTPLRLWRKRFSFTPLRRTLRLGKKPPLPKGRGTTEGGGGIHKNKTYHHKEQGKLKDKIRTERIKPQKFPVIRITE